MLNISEDAATLIRTLMNAQPSDQTGLRIIVDPVNHSLSMSIADDAAPGDSIVVSGEARVFLSSSAAHRLDRRTLRAEISENRSLFFLDN